MSLRVRLNLLITALFLLALLAGSSYIIRNARVAVDSEMQSTAQLTLQLLEVIVDDIKFAGDEAEQKRLLEKLSALETTRHLQIIVSNEAASFPRQLLGNEQASVPGVPEWFVRLVEPPPMEFKHVFSDMEGRPHMEILVRANPADEIKEAWDDSRDILIFLILFIIVANILVYMTLGRDLAPIESILEGLNRIEKGDYGLRLPKFRLPELERIADKFNHMAGVLQQSREDNRYLTQQSLAIEERERRRLAQELHDELGQSISAIKAMAVSVDQQSGDVDAVSDGSKTIISLSERMYDVARSMMQRLRPTILDELGLLTALQELIDSWNSVHAEVFCRFTVETDISGLGEELDINLYRIIQEALTNVSKHARASEVHVRFSRETQAGLGYIMLTIRDDGHGLGASNTRGLGLLGMRERVSALQGEFKISSETGKGTEIMIYIPVSGSGE